MKYRLFFCFVLLFTKSYLNYLSAQIPDTSDIHKDSTHLDSIIELPLELSSLDPITLKTIQLDTSKYIITPKNFFGLVSLNNIGSPVNYLREKRNNTLGFDNGFRVLDFMDVEVERIPFFLTNKTYAELTVSEANFILNSRSGLIDNLNAGAFITKNFANHIYLNLKYDRINQRGIYNNSRNLLARLNAQLLYWNDSSRWSYEINYVNQFDKIEHSMGITTDSILTDSRFRVREAISVVNNSANSRILGDQYYFKLRYKLLNQKVYTSWFEMGVGYKNYNNNFVDYTEPDSINTFYGPSLKLFTDSIEVKYQQNSIPINATINIIKDSTWAFGINNYFQQVSILQNSYPRIRNWSLTNQLFLEYKALKNQSINFQYLRKIQSAQNGSEVGFQYSNSASKIFSLNVGLNYASIIPGFLNNRLVVNDSTIWNHQLNNIRQLDIQSSLLPKLKFLPIIHIRLGSMSNIYFLDSTQSLKQEDRSHQFIDLNLIEDLSFRRVGLLNTIRYLSYQPDPAGWNAWSSRHAFYYNYRVRSSSITSRLSAYAEFESPSVINGFNPLFSMFYPIRDNNKVLGPFVGVELNAQVSDLNISLEFNNLDSFWNSQRPYILAIYPRYDFNIRIQLLWRFRN